MSDVSPNLALPYISPGQAQKHVTHNEAVRALDALTQIAVDDRDSVEPPATPDEGARYIVAAGAAGDWAGYDHAVAAWQDGAWAFYPPAEGWLAWIRDEDILVVWDGAAWVVAGSGGTGSGDLVGINTTAVLPDRLAVKSDAVLFTHDDVTPGSGDVRVKFDKADAASSTSLLFQTAFSARAEVGLLGDDDLRVKVSSDGATFRDALVLDRLSGAVTFPNTPPATFGGGVTSSDRVATHEPGLVAEYLFRAGDGSSIADTRGGPAMVIDASVGAAEWTAQGVRLRGARVQTPALTGGRTAVLIYRLPLDEADGPNLLESSGTSSYRLGVRRRLNGHTDAIHAGFGGGVAPVLLTPTIYDQNIPYRLNRGGWQTLFVQFPANGDPRFAIGGRVDNTNPAEMPSQLEVAYAAVYNDVLTDAERDRIYRATRQIMVRRGVFLDWRDCPLVANCVILAGQSNAEGRALISNLSSTQKAKRFPAVLIADHRGGTRKAPRELAFGINHNPSASQLGPEIGAALRHNDFGHGLLGLCKITKGSTWLAPSTVGGVPSNSTWNVGEDIFTGTTHTQLLPDLWSFQQRMLEQGIGPRLRAFWWMQGENDAISTAQSAGYQSHLQGLWDHVKAQCNQSGLDQIVVARIRDTDPAADAIAVAEVRAAQAAFVAANPGEATLIDTDGFSMQSDAVHFDAPGQVALGDAFHQATSWT
ncbi:MAG: DUF2793 domain-containing protein [Pseudomonadota bacterium]